MNRIRCASMIILVFAAGVAVAAAAEAGRTASPEANAVAFAAPWTSPFHVDPQHPYQLVNAGGRHLFILNKTAWAYFGCKDPAGVLRRARAQGITVLRAALEGEPYQKELNIDMWPWGGTRRQPDWTALNETYWAEVERRVRMAGEAGFGLDICLYFTLKPGADEVARMRPYWQETLRRLGKYANVLTWEIANEYVGNEAFQDAAGEFFTQNDSWRRPVCTSDGPTDDAVWPAKAWMGLAINHSCTSSTPRHGLREWYLAVARNTRAHGRPAWCNESGREKRHGNDDPVSRRKQGWLWNAAGCFWTHHAWDGCEGIDDNTYHAPGEEYLKPLAELFQGVPFWEMDPNATAIVIDAPALVSATLARPDRGMALAYACTERSGENVAGMAAVLHLPPGSYEARFVRPADGKVIGQVIVRAEGIHKPVKMELPEFVDDLAVVVERKTAGAKTRMPGTE